MSPSLWRQQYGVPSSSLVSGFTRNFREFKNKMRVENKTFTTEHSRLWLRFLLIAVVAILVVVPVTLNAQAANKAPNPHSKLAADLADFPQNADGTVNVIVQFKQTPKA